MHARVRARTHTYAHVSAKCMLEREDEEGGGGRYGGGRLEIGTERDREREGGRERPTSSLYFRPFNLGYNTIYLIL
jgi:hypothetical protein